jgi:cyclopropane fatty-acyl-phospholipid synthase-like methyltransferase
MEKDMFYQLESINERPKPYEFYTAEELWADEHTSEQMLACHLNSEVDLSSRRGEFISRSVEWITAHFEVDSSTRIADFGCGPGLYASRLAGTGARVTGIDFSRRSIEYAQAAAKRSGLSIDYNHQNYLEFVTDKRFDLIIMIMCDFCALSPVQRMTMLEKFHSLLLPGGAVMLDVYSLNAYDEREETTLYSENLLDGFWSKEKYYGYQNTFKYDPEKVVLDKYTIVEAARIRTVYNWLQYFSAESLKREFGEAGFNQTELVGDVVGASFDEAAAEFAIIGKK